MKLAILLLFCSMLVACKPDPSVAMGALESTGFVDISLGDHSYISGCPEEATTNVEFTAIQSANNRRVHGIVCCDLFGTCTVRTRN